MVTNETTEQTIDIGTDTASFYLFHPDDLAHRREAPIAWTDYEFACGKEFAARRLVAFRTGDGGYRIRITTGELTTAEQEAEAATWEFGYAVRHGRVLLDNGDFLPGEEARAIDNAPAEQWFVVPNGEYRVTVHAIERAGDETLADYVIRLESVAAPIVTMPASTPPDLLPRKGTVPRAVPGVKADMVYTPDEEKPLDDRYPFLLLADRFVLPGKSDSAPVSDALFEALENEASVLQTGDDTYFVVAPTEAAPVLAALCQVSGYLRFTGEPGRIKLRGERLVQVVQVLPGDPVPRARVEPVRRNAGEPPTSETVAALKQAFANYADTHPELKRTVPYIDFERERIAEMTSGESLTALLLPMLPIPPLQQATLHTVSPRDRARDLIAFLRT